MTENRYTLERTLTLPAALAIGIGTMVGAGIFVFPGLAIGDAGPAAVISFMIAGMIALLVALATAELATAMPMNGGGYYYISRTFGPLPGLIVGVGQSVGLIFASAFYLAGFGAYAVQILEESGLSMSDPRALLACGTALTLTLINIFGTKQAGDLQNKVVVTLTTILAFLFLYGLGQVTGLVGEPVWPKPFAPSGITPIFTTAALIFTAYLGFVQIATVAGEIKAPQANLPMALAGSVVIVTLLYALAIFVASALIPQDQMAELGETAMVVVGEALLGSAGGLMIMAAGLLATLSSANASILSASRSIYALGKDRFIPGAVSQVNHRFGTPHIALILVGLPIAALTLMGRVEVLAEVASLLHLVLYGLICLALIRLRYRQPLWYAPTFEVPMGKLVALIGAICCFGLIALMAPLSQKIGGGVIGLTLIWYLLFARGKTLSPPSPMHISPALRTPHMLIPVSLPDPQDPPPIALLQSFRGLDLFVLGINQITEQASPDQVREESEDEMKQALEAYIEPLKSAGLDPETALHFSANPDQTLIQAVKEENIHAVLAPKPITAVKRLILPIYDQAQVNARIGTVVRDLSRATGATVQPLLFPAHQPWEMQEEPSEKKRRDIDGDLLARYVRRTLRRSGLYRSKLSEAEIFSKDQSMTKVISEWSSDTDCVIFSQRPRRSYRSLFTALQNDIRQAAKGPVLLILNPEENRKKDKS